MTELATNEYGYANFHFSASWRITFPAALKKIDVAALSSLCAGMEEIIFLGDAPKLAYDPIMYPDGISDLTMILPQNPKVFVKRDTTGWGSVPGLWKGLSTSYYGESKFTVEDGVLTSIEPNGASQITIPDTVTRIGDQAFSNRLLLGVEHITIPSSVKSISSSAFAEYVASPLVYPFLDRSTYPGLITVDGWIVDIDHTLDSTEAAAISKLDLSTARGIADGFSCNIAAGNYEVIMPAAMTELATNEYGTARFYFSTAWRVTFPATLKKIDAASLNAFYYADEIVFLGDAPTLTYDPIMYPDGISDLTMILPYNPKVFVKRGTTGWGEVPGLWNGLSTSYCGESTFTVENGVLTSIVPNGASQITIPDTVTRIGDQAFSNRLLLGVEHITIPSSVKSISSSAFAEYVASPLVYPFLDRSTYPGLITVDGWIVGNDTTLDPTEAAAISKLDLSTARGIADNFSYCGTTPYFEVIMPSTMTELATNEYGYANFHFSASWRITFPAALKKIDVAALSSLCAGMEEIIFLGDAPKLAYDPIMYPDGISDLTMILPQNPKVFVKRDTTGWGSVPGLWKGLSTSYYGESKFTVEDGVLTSIEPNGASQITIPDTVTRIGDQAFSNRLLLGVEHITIPSSVKSISSSAFAEYVASPLVYPFLDRSTYPGLITVDGWIVDIDHTLDSTEAAAISKLDLSTARGIADGFSCNIAAGNYEVIMPAAMTELSTNEYGIVAFSFDPWRVTFPATLKKIDVAALSAFGAVDEIIFLGDAPTLTYDPMMYLYPDVMSDLTMILQQNPRVLVKRGTTGWGVEIPGSWLGLRIGYFDEDISYRTVMFNSNGGVVDENYREVAKDGIVGELPIPKRDGYVFEGWWTALEGGECVTATTIVSDDAIYYAHWGAVSEPSPADGDALYCVIDLSGGVSASSYPVSYLSEVPSGGWSDEYKTTKLVLRRMQSGSFMMLGSCNVTLTKPFYIGVFEVTQKQYELVMGESPWLADEIKYISGYEKFGRIGDSHPAYGVTYDMVRGASSGSEWPASAAVDGSSFMGRIRAKTGMDGFDLPTEAQWEYACRAGTTATFGYSYGDSADGDYMWYEDNSDSGPHAVGEKLPNPWGLYDMHGNVREWCLDWFDSLTPRGFLNWWDRLPTEATDPVGPPSGIGRVWRSGSYSSTYNGCWSSDGSCADPSTAYSDLGLRLALTLTTGGGMSDDGEPSTFAEWANTLRGGKWLTGKIDDIAESYQARIESDGADYEARLLHAAALVASLAENSTLKSYIAMFGFEFDYLGLALSGEESDPATWPDANELVDAVVVQCAPVLQAALDDLRAIPVRWTGEVHLASTIWPLDEDVYVDIADVLCARAGIESMLGTLYFLQGYDLTVDWPKARNIDKPQIPLLEHAPSMENDDGWDGALTWSSKYDGSSAGPAIQMAFTGNALYIRLNSADGFEDDDLLECIWIGGAVGYREISVGYFVWDGNFTVNDGTVPYPEWIDGMDWSEWQELYNQYSANDIACPAEFNRSTNGITICVDVSGALSDGDIRKMALSYADILFERPSHPHYRYGWYDTNYSYAGDGKLNRIASFLEEQTNVLSSVRSLDSLAVSKEWMRGALTDALAAYAAMTNRAEDGKYRFVEYDPALSNQLDVARANTEKALASLDAVVTLDCAETFGKYNPDKDYTLLPDNGVMQVYLGALFSGGLNRDLVPTLELDKYAALKPTGIIPDPTFGGVFLSASASTWIDAFNKNNISHSLHAGSGASDVTIAESEKIDTAVQSENGSYVINAKEGVTLAKEDVIISAKIGDENADVSEGYDIAISADGKTAVATLKPPTMVDVAALPPEDGAEKDEDDGAGVLVSVPEAKIAEKPTPTAEELANGNKEVGALPIKTVRGLYYQAGWGDGLDNMRMGNKVQATGGNLYLGVIKQTGKSGFYRLNVSEK